MLTSCKNWGWPTFCWFRSTKSRKGRAITSTLYELRILRKLIIILLLYWESSVAATGSASSPVFRCHCTARCLWCTPPRVYAIVSLSLSVCLYVCLCVCVYMYVCMYGVVMHADRSRRWHDPEWLTAARTPHHSLQFVKVNYSRTKYGSVSIVQRFDNPKVR